MEERLREVEREVAVIQTDIGYLKETLAKQEEMLGEIHNFMVASRTGGKLFRLFFLACSAALGGLATKAFDLISFKN